MAVVPDSDSGWLSVVPTTAPGPVTVMANITGLKAGNFGGKLTISGEGVNSAPMVIPVGLAVRQ
jgi:hypothetical protein